MLLPGTNSPVCSVRCAGDLVRQAKTWDELVAAVQAELGAVREARVALRLVRRKDLILRAKMPGLVFPRQPTVVLTLALLAHRDASSLQARLLRLSTVRKPTVIIISSISIIAERCIRSSPTCFSSSCGSLLLALI